MDKTKEDLKCELVCEFDLNCNNYEEIADVLVKELPKRYVCRIISKLNRTRNSKGKN